MVKMTLGSSQKQLPTEARIATTACEVTSFPLSNGLDLFLQEKEAWTWTCRKISKFTSCLLSGSGTVDPAMSSPIVSLQNHPTSFLTRSIDLLSCFFSGNIKLQAGYPPGFQLKRWKSGTLEHLGYFFYFFLGGGGKNPLPLVHHLVCNSLLSGLAMTTCSAVAGSYLTNKHRIMSPSLINFCEKPMSVCTNCSWN